LAQAILGSSEAGSQVPGLFGRTRQRSDS